MSTSTNDESIPLSIESDISTINSSEDFAIALSTAMKYQGVFHSLDAVLAPLKSEQYAGLPEVVELLNIYKNSLTLASRNENNTKKNLFIVLEGLDGSGKSTITKKLGNALLGSKMYTPPPSISHLRPLFDEHGPILRRAYYSLGNYIAANEIKSRTEPVIMDRFWNSTAAYAIGNEVKRGKPLPPHDSPVYQWPSDLLQPDYVIYLTVDENVRLERLLRRRHYTAEENELKANKIFRENLEEIYKRMKPDLHFVNCNFSARKVVNIIKKDILKM